MSLSGGQGLVLAHADSEGLRARQVARRQRKFPTAPASARCTHHDPGFPVRASHAGEVADTLDRFHIVGKKDLYPRQLSGGQQQLVGVARAIISNPKLILADEPTGNLHSSQGEEIMELFKQLNSEGTTIVQVTHSEKNAGYGNRIVQLRDGFVV